MGSSTPARTFSGPTPFGATPPSPIATETQPLAMATGVATPAMSGYSMAPQTPATPATPQPDSSGYLGDLQTVRQRLSANRGNQVMPFYG